MRDKRSLEKNDRRVSPADGCVKMERFNSLIDLSQAIAERLCPEILSSMH